MSTVDHAHTTTGPTTIPGPRTPRTAEPAPASTARRAFAVLRGLRSMRPVPLGRPEPYGESDGQ